MTWFKKENEVIETVEEQPKNISFGNIQEVSGGRLLDYKFRIPLPGKEVIVELSKIDYTVKTNNIYFIVIGDNEIPINKEFYDWYSCKR